jgi:tRNA(fMet)-specific endonuclease VapC
VTRYLLDSGIASDYIHRRHGVYARARRSAREGHQLGLGTPVLGELLGGILASASRDRNLPILERNLGRFRLWPFDERAAREYGRLWAELRRLGRHMQVPEHANRRHRTEPRQLRGRLEGQRPSRSAGTDGGGLVAAVTTLHVKLVSGANIRNERFADGSWQRIKRPRICCRPDLKRRGHVSLGLALGVLAAGDFPARLIEFGLHVIAQLKLVFEIILDPCAKFLDFSTRESGDDSFNFLNRAHGPKITGS